MLQSRWLVYIVGSLLILAMSFTLGYQYAVRGVIAKEKATAERALARAAELQAQLDAANLKTTVKYVTTTKTIRTRGDTIVKKIPVYITPKDDANCVIPDGFRVHWDATLAIDASGNTDGATPTTTEP